MAYEKMHCTKDAEMKCICRRIVLNLYYKEVNHILQDQIIP